MQVKATVRQTTSHLPGWLLLKRPGITNVGEDVEQREPPCTLGGV